jgi:hypothetical protein
MNWRYYNPKFEYEEVYDDIATPWGGHKYFAYDFVSNLNPKNIVELGTCKGTSFFSFCQAVKDQNINCELIAVDTWKGDPHAMYYGEEVFTEVKNIKESYYQNLKINFIRSTFDEASELFADNSIDMLHIDGYHTYNAVKHDFELWLKKVSSNGIVMFHDITEIRDDFGVHLFWAEIKEKYKTIEFHHSHGLGILFINPESSKNIEQFQEIWKNYYSLNAEYNLIKSINNQKEREPLVKYDELKKMNEDLIRKNEEIKQKDKEMIRIKSSLSYKFSKIISLLSLIFRPVILYKNLKNKLDFLQVKKLIKQSNLFDEDYYLRNNPDVKASGVNSIEHYYYNGLKEGRNPSLTFNNYLYLLMYEDVRKNGINPLFHYIKYGMSEGRSIQAE